MSARSMGEAALQLAGRGWAVLPLAGKAPRTRRGVHDATTDAVVVAAWWQRWPRANIGARVPAGLLVLDVDPRNGGLATLEGWRMLPPTITVWSGRGDGGRHLYFRHPGGPVTGRWLPPGVDLKTHSGYLVVPPSRHPVTGQPYTWGDVGIPATAPEWLVELLRPIEAMPPRGGSGQQRVRVADAYAAAAVQGEARRVLDAQPGGRNAALNRAAFALGTLVGAHRLDADEAATALLAAAEAVGLVDDDGPDACQRTIASGLRAGAEHPRGASA